MAREMKDSGIEWIGEIPKEWDIRNIRNLFSFGKGLNITKENLKEQGIAVISYGQTHSKLNPFYKISDDLIRFVDESYLKTGNLSLVNQGDFIFADTSEDVQGCGNFIYVDRQQNLFAGYHTIILRSLTSKDNKFFAFLFMSDCWRKQIRECVNGVKLFSISQKLIKKTSILVPPEDEKARIVNYLEEHCATIDHMLEKNRVSIEEYKKLKQAVITQAVTKGIRGDREIKDSGVEWIGEIPLEWKIIRIKWVLSERKEKSESGEEEPLSMSQKYGIIPTREMKMIPNMASSFIGEKIVHSGDLVFNKLKAHLGVFAVSQFNGLVSPDYAVYYSQGIVDVKYLEYLFKTPQYITEFKKRSSGVGAGLTRLYTDELYDIYCLLPPQDEQIEIIEYLNKKIKEIDTLIEKKKQYLAEIENYKKSLIYEYVTGKKEVPCESTD